MTKEAKILVGLALIIALVGGVATYIYQSKTSTAKSENLSYGVSLRQEFVREDSPTLGPKNAKVTLVEFLDPECESCRAFFPIVKRVLEEYQGKIHFVVRYMPFHTSSVMAVAATEAAGLQGKYWEMQELLFNSADEWGHQPSPRKDLFMKYAAALELDTERFSADLDDPRWPQKAMRDMDDGKILGVQGTPTFFVNGEAVSELSYEGLKKSLDLHLGPSPSSKAKSQD